jgi:SAM-dependent methyltransferase
MRPFILACPVCDARFVRFRKAHPDRADRGVCPRCGSRQRHRLLWLYLDAHTSLSEEQGRVLHFAPEPGLAARLLETLKGEYLTADIVPGRADLCLDLERLDLASESVAVVLCVHVLEHVADDRAALCELHRVLVPGGWGVIQVPIFGDRTDEDPAVIDPEQREVRFGQRDHVRVYGRDFEARLREAGFDVEIVLFREELTGRQRARLGLNYDLDAELGEGFNETPEPWEIWRVHKPRQPPASTTS